MGKGIGFSRTITLDWLDVTASLCVQNIEPLSIRQHLSETISGAVTGTEAQRKTIDVLLAIWVKTEKSDSSNSPGSFNIISNPIIIRRAVVAPLWHGVSLLPILSKMCSSHWSDQPC